MLKPVLYFAFITVFYLCPAIPMSIKGITGIIFITISSTKTSLKGGLFTAILLITLQTVNYVFDNNVDFQKNIIHAIAGSLMYFLAAFYLGTCADKMKKKNKELQAEIEARKCAEKELKDQEILMLSIEEEKLIIGEMQKYDRLKTEFFSNISHELRTPLNVIFCAVQLMEMHLNDRRHNITRGFVKKNVSTIRQNSLRLLRLVNNLIDMTKIDAQDFEIRLRNQDIVSLVKEITLSAADYIANKGLRLIFHSDIEEKIMAFDEEKIERILLNLLSNAIKFSPPGAAVYVDLADNGNTVFIKVRDMGIGIPPERRQDIFQRFYQISPMHTRLHEGSGIGLSLVKSLIDMHHGAITVESEYGNGSTFIVELPCTVSFETTDKVEPKNLQARVENIRLEFSDIELGNNTYQKAE